MPIAIWLILIFGLGMLCNGFASSTVVNVLWVVLLVVVFAQHEKNLAWGTGTKLFGTIFWVIVGFGVLSYAPADMTFMAYCVLALGLYYFILFLIGNKSAD